MSQKAVAARCRFWQAVMSGRQGKAECGMHAVQAARTRIEHALTVLSAAGIARTGSTAGPGGLEWLPPGESAALVRHWADDLGAERYGHLALIPPAAGYMYGAYPAGMVPAWLAGDAGPVFVLFQDYRAAGLARCSWAFVLVTMAAMAAVDGNGFAAVSGDLAGVLLVDPSDGDDAPTLEIMAWGDLITTA
jgi:hypothetical protein